MANQKNIENYKFKKGQTGNPNGRPKKIPELVDLVNDVLGEEKDGVSAVKAIVSSLRAKATKGDIRAAEILLAYAYGKPKQNQDILQIEIKQEQPLFPNK
jgi:hypothetical protein